MDQTGFGGRVGEYDTLQQSAGADVATSYVSTPNHLTVIFRGNVISGGGYGLAKYDGRLRRIPKNELKANLRSHAHVYWRASARSGARLGAEELAPHQQLFDGADEIACRL